MKRYINELLRLKCASDLLAKGLFPNAKEITESFGAYNAVRAHILKQTNIRTDDPEIRLLVVGDGIHPRTGALFAYRTKWACTSVDPLMKEPHLWDVPNIDRLVSIQAKIEDVSPYDQLHTVIMVLVHAHVPLSALRHIKAGIAHIVAIPCCVPQDIPGKTYTGYVDRNIWSPNNTVKVFLNIHPEEIGV